ncbi:MAG: carboxymuconolactone decarboxylase family protein [Cyclobacteriaceae bacterium]|nr:carboxymuconolactone decarboxylase family protein [Cyclobacteriaceae bacterium]
MEKFKHLDAKTIELAGIAASIAGGCRPCLDFHFKKALELGCSTEQAKEAIELGKMIKQRPINDIYEHADKLTGTQNSDKDNGINISF